MNCRKLLETVICATFLLATSSAAVLGQNDPVARGLLAGHGEDSPPLSAETMAAPSQSAGCCDVDCCQSCCCPRWTASADFIILDRIGGANQTLVERVPNTPTPDRVPGFPTFGALFTAPGAEALNGNDFQQGFCGGPRVGLIRHGDSGCDLELSYFQIDGWRSDQTVVPYGPNDCLVMKRLDTGWSRARARRPAAGLAGFRPINVPPKQWRGTMARNFTMQSSTCDGILVAE